MRWFLLFTPLFLLALFIDRPVAHWVFESGIWLQTKHNGLATVAKFPGSFYCTLILAGLLGLRKREGWKIAMLLILTAIITGLLYALGTWSVGRIRPVASAHLTPSPFTFRPFSNGLLGLANPEPNQAFPSGHACLAFATAAVLASCYPRFRWYFFAGAAVVGLQRILEGAHYPSDVIAGAALGIAAMYIARFLCRLCLNEPRNIQPNAFPLAGDSRL